MRDVKKGMIGVGDLLSQKLLFGAAAIGLHIPVSFFKYCLPGSSQHMKLLKKPPYHFVRPDQVKQLVTSIAVKGGMVPQVAEEVVCLGLKGDASLSLYQEVSIKDCDLFSVVFDKDRRIQVRRLDNQSRHQVPATRDGFSMSPNSGYFPDWAKYKDTSRCCSNLVRMSSESNLKFSMDRSTATQIKTLEKETVHFDSPDVDYSWVQGLIHSNKYVHLSDPIGELADYLDVSTSELIVNIEVCRKGEGHVAFLKSAVYKNVSVDIRFLQVDETSIDRRPIIDVLDSTDKGWCYCSKNGAYLALFLHCICNLHLRHKDHWGIEYLKHSKELLILLPTTQAKDTSAVVAVVYRSTSDSKIRLRQISNKCNILPPMVITEDYNRYFHKRRKHLCF
jgi:hypothetical protein